MEFIEELKHAWSLKRKDTLQIEKRVLESYKDKDYKNVIELCSKLDYNKNSLDTEVAYALCYSIWAEPGNDSEAMGIAKKCAEYYDESRFKEICSYAQEYWANQKIKTIKSFYETKSESDVWSLERESNKKIAEIIESSFNDPLETYNNALSWQHENDSLQERIKEKIFKAYKAWIEITLKMGGLEAVYEDSSEPGESENWHLTISGGARGYKLRVVLKRVIEIYEKALGNKHSEEYKYHYTSEIDWRYFDLSSSHQSDGYSNSGSWKTRPQAISDFESALYYEEKRDRDGAKLIKKIEDLKVKIAEDNKKFGKPLKDFPEASGFCNKLIKAGYTTLGDFLKASESEIDKIPKIGPSAMKEIRAFRDKF